VGSMAVSTMDSFISSWPTMAEKGKVKAMEVLPEEIRESTAHSSRGCALERLSQNSRGTNASCLHPNQLMLACPYTLAWTDRAPCQTGSAAKAAFIKIGDRGAPLLRLQTRALAAPYVKDGLRRQLRMQRLTAVRSK